MAWVDWALAGTPPCIRNKALAPQIRNFVIA